MTAVVEKEIIRSIARIQGTYQRNIRINSVKELGNNKREVWVTVQSTNMGALLDGVNVVEMWVLI